MIVRIREGRRSIAKLKIEEYFLFFILLFLSVLLKWFNYRGSKKYNSIYLNKRLYLNISIGRTIVVVF